MIKATCCCHVVQAFLVLTMTCCTAVHYLLCFMTHASRHPVLPATPYSCQDDVAIIWLQNKSDASAAVAALRKNASALGISSLIYGSDLVKQGLAASEGDSRAPDIVVKVGSL